MEPILQLGLETIYWMQEFRNPLLDAFFHAITILGNGGFYLLVFPIVYWCFDRKLAARIGLVVLLSGLLNFDLKELIGQPRPFYWDPSVQLHPASGFGLPSGHAQVTLSIGGYLILLYRHQKVTLLITTLVFLIGLSRIYLGVHFPTDVLAGWAVGIVFLSMYWPLEKPLSRWLARQTLFFQSLLVILVPVGLYLIFPNPHAVIVTGSMIGLGFGYLLNQNVCTFDKPPTRPLFWLRLIVSLFLTILLLFGLRSIFPPPDASGYVFWRLVRYCLTGFFITFLAPCLFNRWESVFRKR
jgi:undecaprenyl-diphosphatase